MKIENYLLGLSVASSVFSTFYCYQQRSNGNLSVLMNIALNAMAAYKVYQSTANFTAFPSNYTLTMQATALFTLSAFINVFKKA